MRTLLACFWGQRLRDGDGHCSPLAAAPGQPLSHSQCSAASTEGPYPAELQQSLCCDTGSNCVKGACMPAKAPAAVAGTPQSHHHHVLQVTPACSSLTSHTPGSCVLARCTLGPTSATQAAEQLLNISYSMLGKPLPRPPSHDTALPALRLERSHSGPARPPARLARAKSAHQADIAAMASSPTHSGKVPTLALTRSQSSATLLKSARTLACMQSYLAWGGKPAGLGAPAPHPALHSLHSLRDRAPPCSAPCNLVAASSGGSSGAGRPAHGHGEGGAVGELELDPPMRTLLPGRPHARYAPTLTAAAAVSGDAPAVPQPPSLSKLPAPSVAPAAEQKGVTVAEGLLDSMCVPEHSSIASLPAMAALPLDLNLAAAPCDEVAASSALSLGLARDYRRGHSLSDPQAASGRTPRGPARAAPTARHIQPHASRAMVAGLLRQISLPARTTWHDGISERDLHVDLNSPPPPQTPAAPSHWGPPRATSHLLHKQSHCSIPSAAGVQPGGVHHATSVADAGAGPSTLDRLLLGSRADDIVVDSAGWPEEWEAATSLVLCAGEGAGQGMC